MRSLNMSLTDNYNVLGRFRHLILPATSGIILAMAMPEPGWSVLAWVGLVPLMVALRGVGAKRAALCGLISGLVYYAVILRWISLFGFLPWVLLSIQQALFFAAFAAIFVRVSPNRIGGLGYVAVPAAWTALQYMRTLGPYAFIWGNLAHSQANSLYVSQIAAITGPWGIDFLLCFVSLAISYADLRKRRALIPMAAAVILIVGVLTFGIVSMRAAEPAGPHRKVAVLQGNMKNDLHPIPNYIPKALQRYSELTRYAANSKPDVILWPETALPTDISDSIIASPLSDLAIETGSFLLVGGYDLPDPVHCNCIYNSLQAIAPDGEYLGVYRKVHLVPYGEFVPMRKQMPFLSRYGVRDTDLCAAHQHTLLDTPIGKVGTSICFESTFSHIAREEALGGAEILCVVSNDAWFQRTPAAQQHFMMARLRAIENRRYLMRAAGTGISAVIDPHGRVHKRLGLFVPGIIIDDVVASRSLTIYTLYGDWFAYLSLIVVAIGVLVKNASPSKSKHGKHRPGTSRR
ncbi:MAG: apolipoprotein N-acyltransferase [Armatimonadota bacterium]